MTLNQSPKPSGGFLMQRTGHVPTEDRSRANGTSWFLEACLCSLALGHAPPPPKLPGLGHC